MEKTRFGFNVVYKCGGNNHTRTAKRYTVTKEEAISRIRDSFKSIVSIESTSNKKTVVKHEEPKDNKMVFCTHCNDLIYKTNPWCLTHYKQFLKGIK